VIWRVSPINLTVDLAVYEPGSHTSGVFNVTDDPAHVRRVDRRSDRGSEAQPDSAMIPTLCGGIGTPGVQHDDDIPSTWMPRTAFRWDLRPNFGLYMNQNRSFLRVARLSGQS
jgi:hypothetical protein